MFLKMYIFTVLRNLLIFIIIIPTLMWYTLSLIYRVPNIDKEKLLTYLIETEDLSILKSPIKEYFYFRVTVSETGDIENISDTTLPEEIRDRFIMRTIDKDFHGKKGGIFNVVPD